MNKWLKAAIIIPVVVFVLIVVSYFILRTGLGRSLPQVEGELNVNGTNSPVEIFRGEYGIPLIYGENEEDAAFALGFVHAQDRLFQMDLMRRAASGRISEVTNEEALPVDYMFRTIGMQRFVDSNYARIDDNTKRIFEAYSEGVNEYIRISYGVYPPEFSLLGYYPQDWKPEDCYLIEKLFAWMLNLGWWTDVAMARVAEKTGCDKLREILPLPDGAAVIDDCPFEFSGPISNGIVEADRLFRKYLAFESSMTGSNNWVVSGEKSKSGKPLMANDTHLALSKPSIWYIVSISGGDWNAAGYTVPGVPAVIIGQNREICWSSTNLMADDSDFYIEKLDSTGAKYMVDQEWLDLEIITDTIYVKDGEPVEFKIRSTHRGPLVHDIHTFGLIFKDSVEYAPVSMSWTGYRFSDNITALRKVNKASGREGLKNALTDFSGPGQNFLFADTAGNIGYYAAGLLPQRKSVSGIFIYNGTLSKYDWKKFVPFKSMPSVYNPGEKIIATANNNVGDSKIYISNMWEPDARVKRIKEKLAEKEKFDSEDFKMIQRDERSLFASFLVKSVLDAFGNAEIHDKNLKTAMKLFKNWDGEMNRFMQAPAIYSYYRIELIKGIFGDEMGEKLLEEFNMIPNLPNRILEKVLTEKENSWWDNISSEEIETKDEIVRKSFLSALEKLEETLGENPAEWQWGRVHSVTLKHPFSDRSAILDNLINIGPFEIGGDGTTLMNSGYSFSKPFDTNVGAAMRYICDMADPETMLCVLPGGESGNFLSDNYSDMAPLWMEGELIEINMNRVNTIRGNEKKLTLLPNRK